MSPIATAPAAASKREPLTEYHKMIGPLGRYLAESANADAPRPPSAVGQALGIILMSLGAHIFAETLRAPATPEPRDQVS